jgi:hypothetical protein
MFLNIPKYSLFLFTKKNIWEKIFLEIFNIFMNNMVSVAAKLLQILVHCAPYGRSLCSNQCCVVIIDRNGPQKVIRTVL